MAVQNLIGGFVTIASSRAFFTLLTLVLSRKLLHEAFEISKADNRRFETVSLLHEIQDAPFWRIHHHLLQFCSEEPEGYSLNAIWVLGSDLWIQFCLLSLSNKSIDFPKFMGSFQATLRKQS